MMIAIKTTAVFLFFLGVLLAGPASADGNGPLSGKPAVSTHYDVAFAYAKLAQTTPVYEDLLSADMNWQALGPIDRHQQKRNRLSDLAEMFSSFSPTTTPLRVRLPVRIWISNKPSALVLGHFSKDLPYFPFWDGRRLLTLYTEDFSMLSVLPVEDDLALRRAGYLIDDENDLFLDLIPVMAHPAESKRVDGVFQVLIPAKIAKIHIYNKGGRIIWSWRNPAYDYLDRRVFRYR